MFYIHSCRKQANKNYWYPLHNTPCDELVYNQRRQLLIVNNVKINSQTHLKRLHLDTNENLVNVTIVSISITTLKEVIDLLHDLGFVNFESMMIYRVDTVVSRSYKPCEIYSYDQQITKHFMNKGLRINNIYSELHEGNVLQVCYSVLSDCYSKKVITKKHKMAFDVTTTDFTSVSRYVFENNSSFDLDRLYRTLAEYSVGDKICMTMKTKDGMKLGHLLLSY